jgi:hypothetical protein
MVYAKKHAFTQAFRQRTGDPGKPGLGLLGWKERLHIAFADHATVAVKTL